MKTKHLMCLVAIFIITTIHLQAGSVQTNPAYDGSNVIIATPEDDGSAEVTYTITSSDSTFNVYGVFENADSFDGDFPSGSPKVETVTYTADKAGLESDVTLTITTSDAGGACTAFNRRPRLPWVNAFMATCYGGRLASALSIADFISNLHLNAPSVMFSRPKLEKQTINFKVLILRPRLRK